MTFAADGQAVSLVYAIESDFAQLPADGAAVREIVHNRSKLSGEPTIRGRGNITADHAVGDLFVTGEMGRAMYSGEVRIGQLDDALAALVSTTWSQDADLDIVGNVGVIGASPPGQGFVTLLAAPDFLQAGDIVKLTGFTNAANNVYGRVAAIETAGPLVQVSLDDLPASLVTESASAATRLHLANDVVILNETDLVSTGTGFMGPPGELTFSLLVIAPGQIVFVEFAGFKGFMPVRACTANYLAFAAALPVPYTPGLAVTIKGSRLINPQTVATRREQSLRFEATWPDIDKQLADTGVKVDKLHLRTRAAAPIAFEMTTQSAGHVVDQNVLVESRYVQRALAAGPAVDASQSQAMLLMKSEGVTALVSTVALDILANWKPVRAIGQAAPIDFEAGDFVVGGKLTILFSGDQSLDMFVAGEHGAMTWSIADIEGRGYLINVPDCIIASQPVSQATPDGDVELTLTFKATGKAGPMLIVDRFSCIL